MTDDKIKKLASQVRIIERTCDYEMVVTPYKDGTCGMSFLSASEQIKENEPLPVQEKTYNFASFGDAMLAAEVAAEVAMRARAVQVSDYT